MILFLNFRLKKKKRSSVSESSIDLDDLTNTSTAPSSVRQSQSVHQPRQNDRTMPTKTKTAKKNRSQENKTPPGTKCLDAGGGSHGGRAANKPPPPLKKESRNGAPTTLQGAAAAGRQNPDNNKPKRPQNMPPLLLESPPPPPRRQTPTESTNLIDFHRRSLSSALGSARRIPLSPPKKKIRILASVSYGKDDV